MLNRNVVAASFVAVMVIEYVVYVVYVFGRCEVPSGSDVTNVVVVADPQLVDRYEYPTYSTLVLTMAEMYSDSYMQKSFEAIQFHPLLSWEYIFLGDLFDGGRSYDEVEWQSGLRRFQRIFNTPRGKYQLNHGDANRYYVPGNHDIGIHQIEYRQEVVDRFVDYFGPIPMTATISSFDIVMINAPLLALDDSLKAHPDALLYLTERGQSDRKVILITHIPLHRTKDCLSPSSPKRITVEINHHRVYTNMMKARVSADILEVLQPVVVLSGDHHHTCIVNHSSIQEHTVATFSMAQGNLSPGFVIISLSSDGSSFQIIECNLPPVFHAMLLYIAYLPVIPFLSFTFHAPILPVFALLLFLHLLVQLSSFSFFLSFFIFTLIMTNTNLARVNVRPD